MCKMEFLSVRAKNCEQSQFSTAFTPSSPPAIGWPAEWRDYVMYAQSLRRQSFCDALNAYRSARAESDAKRTRIPTEGGQQSDDCGQPMIAA
jgi:hypothetical protein